MDKQDEHNPSQPSKICTPNGPTFKTDPSQYGPILPEFNQNRGSLRLNLALTWAQGDRSTPEPLLSAREVRDLLRGLTGRGKSEETLLAMGQAGEIPAYEDRRRRCRNGSHPTVFRWSEVGPLLVAQGRHSGPPGKVVRIVPAKRRH